MATPKLKTASAPAAPTRLLRPSGAAPAKQVTLKSATGKTITILPGSVFLSTGLALCLTWRHISVALCACIVGICSHALLTCPDLACGTAYAATLLCLALPLGIKLMTERN